VAAAVGFLLRRRAQGESRPASSAEARLRGVLDFAVCGAAAGLAGVLYAGEYGRLGPTTGRGFGLEVLAAAVLGGASLGGGTGSAAGTAAGAVLVSVLHNGAAMLNVGEMAQAAVFAAVVVVALLANRMLRR
jgi:ribose/xylose/arabinose/galactoside ABC-type transport system permease subunit